jgi:hypothetical protein
LQREIANKKRFFKEFSEEEDEEPADISHKPRKPSFSLCVFVYVWRRVGDDNSERSC